MSIEKWELIVKEGHGGSKTERLKVPDGWLYRTTKHYRVKGYQFDAEFGVDVQLMHVPDNEFLSRKCKCGEVVFDIRNTLCGGCA